MVFPMDFDEKNSIGPMLAANWTNRSPKTCVLARKSLPTSSAAHKEPAQALVARNESGLVCFGGIP